ncbi:hypothetical protein ZIOFF_001517 [Zingiber officinale]|uniref:Uncharacterized protein n=1 Tax=Zingiber officinale TaxID=94328 RepID=A0A8J5LYI6_ZINOF|nr:hypothetical protein ZIOFF_001517 [Zingiber officinale]
MWNAAKEMIKLSVGKKIFEFCHKLKRIAVGSKTPVGQEAKKEVNNVAESPQQDSKLLIPKKGQFFKKVAAMCLLLKHVAQLHAQLLVVGSLSHSPSTTCLLKCLTEVSSAPHSYALNFFS